jgi:hypothetical protein
MTVNVPNFPEGWNHHHALTFTYYTFATVTDGELDKSERDVAMGSLARLGVPADAFAEAIKFFCQEGMTYQIANIIASRCWTVITQSFTREILDVFISDLKSIAAADGKMHPNEASTIAFFESTLSDAKV